MLFIDCSKNSKNILHILIPANNGEKKDSGTKNANH